MSIKSSFYEVCYNVLKDSMLIEMAINRSKIDGLVQSQYHHIAKHYVKIKSLPDHEAVNHWKGEIKGAFARFRGVKYAHNNKRPSVDQWIHHAHNDAPEFDIGMSVQMHHDLKEDDGLKVGEVDHNKIVSGFHDMMRRCFTRVHNDQQIDKEDIY